MVQMYALPTCALLPRPHPITAPTPPPPGRETRVVPDEVPALTSAFEAASSLAGHGRSLLQSDGGYYGSYGGYYGYGSPSEGRMLEEVEEQVRWRGRGQGGGPPRGVSNNQE